MTRPTIGSASLSPATTTAALASTPRLTKPSTRACFPSATRAALQAVAGAEADLCGDLVTDETDHAGSSEQPEMGKIVRVNEALDCLAECDECADEDGGDDGEAGQLLAAKGRRKKASPSGIAVSASPKLWIRAARRATLSVRA